VNRRAFLGASSLVAASALLPRTLAAQGRKSDTPTQAFDPWIEVHTANLAHNVGEVSRAAANHPVLAVIKNNGYGLGVATVARLLEPLPQIAGVAVVKLDEAVTLRDRGLKKPVLLMGPFTTSDLASAVSAYPTRKPRHSSATLRRGRTSESPACR
jgi:alanine racemase